MENSFQNECKQKFHIVISPNSMPLRVRSIRDRTLCHVKNGEQVDTLVKDGAWAYFDKDWTFIRTNAGCKGMIQHKYLIPVRQSSSRSQLDQDAGCRIFDPDDTYANIRQSPNGVLIGPLLNDEKVIIIDIKKDAKARDWALIKYGDRVGFVMRKLVKC